MKKAAAFLCMIVMAVCLSVGISAAEDAKAVYQAAREKTYSLVSVDFTQTEITKSVSETTSPGYSNVTTQEDTETTVLQINASDPANPQMKFKQSLATWGDEPLTEIYVKDSCLYIGLFGTGMKESMSAEELAEVNFAILTETDGPISTNSEDLSEYGTNFALSENSDGTRTVTFQIDIDAILQEYEVDLSFFTEAGGSLTFPENSYTAVISADGYLLSESCYLTVDISYSYGEDYRSHYNSNLQISIVYKNPGQPVSIEFPDDLDEYIDLDAYEPDYSYDPYDDYLFLDDGPVTTDVYGL